MNDATFAKKMRTVLYEDKQEKCVMDNVIIRPFNYNHDQDYVALETVQKAVFPDEWESAAEHKHDILASKQYRQVRFIAERGGEPLGYIEAIERYWEEQSDTFNS